MSRKLGSTQQLVLSALIRHEGWSDDGCGWVWDNHSGTRKIMDSLVRAGVATVEVTPKSGTNGFEVRTYKHRAQS